MNKCFFSRRRNIVNAVAGAYIVGTGIVLMGYSVWQMVIDTVGVSVLLLFVIGLALSLLGIFLYALESREYILCANGFSLRYLNSFAAQYDWKNVDSICVCDVNHAPKNHTEFDLVIRIECATNKQGYSRTDLANLDPYSLWRKQGYNWRRYREVILIEYSPGRLKEIMEATDITVTYSVTNLAIDSFAQINKTV